MSLSEASTVPTRRKRTVTERVTDNGDPLVVKKKAREAEKAKKTTQVIFYHLKENINSLLILQKASVEDDVDEDSIRPQNDIPKKSSRILELSDGSDDEPMFIDGDGDGDTEIMDSGDEAPSETAEAELGK